jgi:predicted N-acyltransferase
MIEFRTHDSIDGIGREAWTALAGADPLPHMRYEFLQAFERTGCVGAEVGWLPSPISMWRDGTLIGAAPAYVKGDSAGEFVFDHTWANFCHDQIGQSYYPKLIVAVPFTPATGPRLLVSPGQDVTELTLAFTQGLMRYSAEYDLSGAHVLFPGEAEATRYVNAGMALRLGIQYHWRNRGYACFDDFLGQFSSKRRNQIKRERRALSEQGIELRVYTGSDLRPEIIDHVFRYYTSTVDKHFYGRQYLNRAFFEEVCSTMGENVLVVLAHEDRGGGQSGRAIAGAFNLIGGGGMYGRYWGASEERSYLHFNVCYYQGIAECIARGLTLFEPGAGGEHKVARGFEPTATYSTHHLRHPAFARVVYDFLAREREAVRRHLSEEKPILKLVDP